MALTERYLTAAYMSRRFYQNQTIPGENTIDEGTAQFIIDTSARSFNRSYGLGNNDSDITDIQGTAQDICGNMMERWKKDKDEPFELTESELYWLQDVFNRIPLRTHDPDDFDLNENL
jgi:hypothetical protein